MKKKIGIDISSGETDVSVYLEVFNEMSERNQLEKLVVFIDDSDKKFIDEGLDVEWVVCKDTEEGDTSFHFVDDQCPSLVFGLKYLEEDKIDVLLSGADSKKLILASFRLKKDIPALKPAFGVFFEIGDKKRLLLDVGAISNPSVDSVVAIGREGLRLVKEDLLWDNPKLGLLNSGVEEYKGNSLSSCVFIELKEDEQIKNSFLGNLEPQELFRRDSADVFLTDGYTGNMILKTIEGIVEFVSRTENFYALPEPNSENLGIVTGELLMDNVFAGFNKPFAVVIGLKKSLFKIHTLSTKEQIIETLSFLFEM